MKALRISEINQNSLGIQLKQALSWARDKREDVKQAGDVYCVYDAKKKVAHIALSMAANQ